MPPPRPEDRDMALDSIYRVMRPGEPPTKETAEALFAGLFFVILIGLCVENFIFASIERRTIHRWGMQH